VKKLRLNGFKIKQFAHPLPARSNSVIF